MPGLPPQHVVEPYVNDVLKLAIPDEIVKLYQPMGLMRIAASTSLPSCNKVAAHIGRERNDVGDRLKKLTGFYSQIGSHFDFNARPDVLKYDILLLAAFGIMVEQQQFIVHEIHSGHKLTVVCTSIKCVNCDWMRQLANYLKDMKRQAFERLKKGIDVAQKWNVKLPIKTKVGDEWVVQEACPGRESVTATTTDESFGH